MDGTQGKRTLFARNQLENSMMPILWDVYPEIILPAETYGPGNPGPEGWECPGIQSKELTWLGGVCPGWLWILQLPF